MYLWRPPSSGQLTGLILARIVWMQTPCGT